MRQSKTSLDTDILFGNISNTAVDNLLSSNEKKAEEAANLIGTRAKQNDRIIKYMPVIVENVVKSIEAHKQVILGTNQIKVAQLGAESEIANSQYTVTQAEREHTLNSTKLYSQNLYDSQHYSNELNTIRELHNANFSVMQASDAQKLRQGLSNIDNGVAKRNYQIGVNEHETRMQEGLTGTPENVRKQYHYIDAGSASNSPSVMAKTGRFLGAVAEGIKKAVGI